jgi:inner membrane protein
MRQKLKNIKSRYSLFFKSLTVAFLALLLLIPLAMVEDLVRERQAREREAKASIAEISAGPQLLMGPMLVLTFEEDRQEVRTHPQTGESIRVDVTVAGHQVIAAKSMRFAADASIEQRHRGIFRAQAYELAATIDGTFAIPQGFGLGERRNLRIGRLYALVGVSDLHGVLEDPQLKLGDRAYSFEQGAVANVIDSGMHVDLGPAQAFDGQEFAYSMPLRLRGSQSFRVAPIAEATKVEVRAPWPTPSFVGHFAASHEESATGFHATWHVSHLARNLDRILHDRDQTEETFGVAFVEPMNVYLQAERAVKYGFLFVLLTFASFFLVEILRRWPIHPISYTLIGLALAFFFLLLLSLAEHIDFRLAYGSASAACIALIGFYLAHVLGSRRLGWSFAAALTLIFALLYGLLSAEDNALVLGSLALFAGLAALMIGTRNVDWYALGEGSSEVHSA